jgi:diguanylate cyclase (GGDEF)-like protein
MKHMPSYAMLIVKHMFDEQAAIVPKLFERRQEELIFALRRERSVIAAKMAATDMLQSGAFNVAVAKAFVEKYEEFAHKLITETFDLLQRSGVQIDSESAEWMSDKVGHYLEVGAHNACGEGNGGRAPTDELRQSVERAIEAAHGRMRRDLQIELDLARASRPAPAATSVEIVDEASIDPLVLLQNRRGLEKAFGELANTGEQTCVVLFDIDHFKEVNDKHGQHSVGDEALKAIADIAASCVKHKGQAFRLSGDEFILLLRNHTRDEGLAVAERFRSEVDAAPLTSKNLTLSVSVGLAVWPSDGATLTEVQNAADEAMYDAKHRRRNLVRYYGETDAAPQSPSAAKRKLPDPGALSEEQQLKIRQDYFRKGAARCPRDEAILRVHDVTAQQDERNRIMVNCPLCGLNEVLS